MQRISQVHLLSAIPADLLADSIMADPFPHLLPSFFLGGGEQQVSTRTGKSGKMGTHFPVREKSGNFEQTGKVRENHTKHWKTQGILNKYYLIFLMIFK